MNEIKRPRTAEEVAALPVAHTFDEKYLYFGAQPIDGDDQLFWKAADGSRWRIECRRETPDGPDVWVRIRVAI